MEVGAIVSSSERLMQALESSRASEGAGLVSSGPGAVPSDLARHFEELLQAAPDPAGSHAQSVQGTQLPDAPATQNEIKGTDDLSAMAERPINEVFMDPMTLYHVQFELSMLTFAGKYGNTVSQSATSNMDNILRQSS